ncbi:hypothetical protein A3709_19460 [Halioglobus sp. HI00S01]|uniref:hypothetical protein n=1 Tax=Halioglobus sp. HI00S01 TaxID=1822214 RepID=UPI0007C2B8E2|nr:hypothetical protein [Halioglobus sp. HI00S01]KZX57803.1 hypothetical protein A3709_19460 [Halioglobus sp. HI00S01]
MHQYTNSLIRLTAACDGITGIRLMAVGNDRISGWARGDYDAAERLLTLSDEETREVISVFNEDALLAAIEDENDCLSWTLHNTDGQAVTLGIPMPSTGATEIQEGAFTYRCPNCGSPNHLEVVAEVWAQVRQSGSGDIETGGEEPQNGSHGWDNDSPMICRRCNFTDDAASFLDGPKHNGIAYLSEYATLVRLQAGALQAAAVDKDWTPGDWVDVTAPESQSFLDAVNAIFDTQFRLENFAGR